MANCGGCVNNDDRVSKQTLHQRNSGDEGSGIQWWFTVNSGGSASATNNGSLFNASGLDHSRTYEQTARE